MPSKSTIRKYIRHPSDVPIKVTLDLVEESSGEADETLTNVSLGGLSLFSRQPLEVGRKISVCIPVLKQHNYLAGSVAWCEKSKNGYEVGLEFAGSRDIFRLRMIEQICHIEHYRKEIKLVEGRELNSEDAAKEWIKRYADDFPA